MRHSPALSIIYCEPSVQHFVRIIYAETIGTDNNIEANTIETAIMSSLMFIFTGRSINGGIYPNQLDADRGSLT